MILLISPDGSVQVWPLVAQCPPATYHCPLCGRTWAIIDSGGDWCHWMQATPCEQCAAAAGTPWLYCPGSLCDRHHGGQRGDLGPGLDESVLAALPPELLARELELHINQVLQS